MKRILRTIAAALAVALGFFAGPFASAQQQATPVVGDTRLVTFDYDENQTFLILTRPRSATHIQLRAGETVRTIALGDASTFNVVTSGDSGHIFIRPKFDNAVTSMTLITSERAYQITLRSTFADQGKWHQRVTWNVPDLVVSDIGATAQRSPASASPSTVLPPAAAGTTASPAFVQERVTADRGPGGLDLTRLNFNYTIEGDAPFRPSKVLDDGRFTFIQIPPTQELPALFAITADGEVALVNYVVRDGWLVAQRLMNQMLLKIQRAEVRVRRAEAAPSRGWFGFGSGSSSPSQP